MPGLLERIGNNRPGQSAQRSSIDLWLSDYLIPAVSQFAYGGSTSLPFGVNTTYGQIRIRETVASLPGYTAALRRCPPAFAAQLVRALTLSGVRFVFRNPPWHQSTPRRTFGSSVLAPLERPWRNATTGDMVGLMEWHEGLAGNSYVHRRAVPSGPAAPTGMRLRVLRPDWVGLLYGSELEPDDPAHALDGELLGYAYANGGFANAGPGQIRTLLPDEVAHWAPMPDPENAGIGMSWITPAVREIQADQAVTEHKLAYFRQGAAQPCNAGMLTPRGWTRMEDIAVGAQVMGPDGKPRRVIGVYPQGEKDIYRLAFSGGATAECCEDHVWQVASAYDRKHGTSRLMTLRQIIDGGVLYPSGPAKWSIPLVDPVEYDDPGPLSLDPYLLGSLLGDGSFRSNGKGSGGVSLAVSAQDADEVQAGLVLLLPTGVTITRRDRGGWSELYFKGPGGPRENPLTRTVRDLGLFDIGGRDKAIPERYMRAPVGARIALLQGLIDTDGHVNPPPATGVTFCSTSEALARQVRELVLGLGGTATCNPAGYRPNEPDRRPQWRVYLNRLPEWITPVRLTRKRASYRPCGRGGRYQYLRHVELIGRQPAQCIKVDADDGLYVTDDFIVTHNTPNMVVKGLPTDIGQFKEIVALLEEEHAGVANAYKTLYLSSGADAVVVGSNLADLDLKGVQGASETRIAELSRVHPVILGSAEGLQGSALNAGNFGMARRIYADSFVYPMLANLAASVAPLIPVPADAELWFDTVDIPLLREDAKDAADIVFVQAQAIRQLVDGGFNPDSAVAAVVGLNLNQLAHSGLLSVQLQEPGALSATSPNGKAPAGVTAP